MSSPKPLQRQSQNLDMYVHTVPIYTHQHTRLQDPGGRACAL